MAIHDEIKQRASARLGDVLDHKWRLDQLLGVGGMAAVYAATHRNKKRAAIKMLHRELGTDSALRRRFLREGYVANTVDHVGAVRVDDDHVSADGSVYLVMELLEGESLRRHRERRGGCLPPGDVLVIAHQLLDVLGAAHGAGVLHRDLKPDNLFITRQGTLKVLDFGIARLRDEGASTATTQTGDLLGTPSFMAPEQAAGRQEDVDERTDLWAVGAVMFTLLSGKTAHEARSVTEALIKVVSDPVRATSSVAPDVPAPIAAVVDCALALEREDRFASATSMRRAVAGAYLEAFGEPIEHAPPVLGEPETPLAAVELRHKSPESATTRQLSVPEPSDASATGIAQTAGGMTVPPSIPLQSLRRPAVLGAVLLACALVISVVVWRVFSQAPEADEPGEAGTGVVAADPPAPSSEAPSPPQSTGAPEPPATEMQTATASATNAASTTARTTSGPRPGPGASGRSLAAPSTTASARDPYEHRRGP